MVVLHVPPGRMAHRRVRAGRVDQAGLAGLPVRVGFPALGALLVQVVPAVPVVRPVRVDLAGLGALVVLVGHPVRV